MKKLILGIVVVVAVSIYGLNRYVEKQLDTMAHTNAYNECHKIWSARGLYPTRSEENTIASFQRAFDAGATGAEVDFFYDPGSETFYVTHNDIIRNPDGSIKDPNALTLEQLLSHFGNQYYWWLDYKNLGRISDEQTQDSIKRLQVIADKIPGIKDKLYIEGSNPLMLSVYTQAGFKTILALDLLPASNPLSEYLVNLYKIAYYFSDITVVASRATHRVNPDNPKYTTRIQEQFSNIPIFLFHTPDDPEYLQELMADPLVRVILVGAGQSIDRFDVHNCPVEQTANNLQVKASSASKG
ncbi:hypothetical protein M9194_02500 [Vibrio sp. S4M6]|uniref:hypothetical protein n=1 Tax=Vibrio sinus TaxID=2946865 RepID=UPI002029CD88|nr:hypothetical protein [Vibrio sinus]MCL9780300.1 hypothetical protein [Vibrio sinus]